MFTGIVETTGRVVSLTRNDFGVRLVIKADDWSRKVNPGDSVSVNGCCLTQAPGKGDAPDALCFDVVKQTLDVTSLGGLEVGDRVNLEAAVTPTTAMGGHFVQGHVDDLATVVDLHAGEDEWRVTFEVARDLLPTVVPKGSVCLDGVSLTIADVEIDSSRFQVVLIPTTLRVTTFGDLQVGQKVNVETDMVARTVVHTLACQRAAHSGGGVSVDTLLDAGFV